LVQEQVPEVPVENLLVEPVGRDTAPCIALAVSHLEARGFNGIMVVLPSDHIVIGYDGFLRSMKTAMGLAEETGGLVTIGIRPTRPETGYGYIRMGNPAWATKSFRVAAFTEKPDAERAMAFLSSGQYLWNSGMFVWKISAIRNALERYLPELAQGLSPIREAMGTPDFTAVLDECFPVLPKVSIDYGVMEKADNVWVVPGDFGWDDLGTWTALERVSEPDTNGNFVQGQALLVDTETTIVRNDNPDKLVVTFGLQDTLVVDTQDVLMVADKSRASELKRLLDELRQQGLDRYLQGLTASKRNEAGEEIVKDLDALLHKHPVIEKPWGQEIWWAVTERYAGKVLIIRAGQALSKQYHRQKYETLLFLKGHGLMELGSKNIEVSSPMAIDIPAGTVHRIRASTDMIVFEVSTPELDDVVRLVDDYGRIADAK
jgi:mannose-1-phosphate guanylyltransferase